MFASSLPAARGELAHWACMHACMLLMSQSTSSTPHDAAGGVVTLSEIAVCSGMKGGMTRTPPEASAGRRMRRARRRMRTRTASRTRVGTTARAARARTTRPASTAAPRAAPAPPASTSSPPRWGPLGLRAKSLHSHDVALDTFLHAALNVVHCRLSCSGGGGGGGLGTRQG